MEEVGWSDLYVGVFWNQYSSPTIEEFKHARQLGQPCFLYVKEFDVRRDSQLQAFLDETSRLGTGVTLNRFINVLDLANAATRDIQRWLYRDWSSKSERLFLAMAELEKLRAMREVTDRDFQSGLQQVRDSIKTLDTNVGAILRERRPPEIEEVCGLYSVSGSNPEMPAIMGGARGRRTKYTGQLQIAAIGKLLNLTWTLGTGKEPQIMKGLGFLVGDALSE
jgi:hypothetical protein